MSGDIWRDDVLGRKEDAQYLQNYLVKRYVAKPKEPGFVLAINAEWGYGKSFLLERWQSQMSMEGHPTIFFNAWKSDFTEDPLLAFIAEFDAGLKEYFAKIPFADQAQQKALVAVKKLWRPVLMVLAGAAAKHLAGTSVSQIKNLISDEDADAKGDSGPAKINFKDAQDNLKNAIDKALKDHNTIKHSIVGFKKKLSFLIEALEKLSGVQLPMVIFVDELDRCRPDYAVELLEGIKHLFGVPGVFFVIATNVQQLGESVKAIYGSGFDGQRYLKRFFDLQYALREPSNAQFATALFKEAVVPKLGNILYGLEHSRTMEGINVVEPKSESILSFVLEKHADAFELALRDMQQVATILEAALLTLKDRKVHIFFLVFLAVVYQKDPVVFTKIARAGNISEATGFDKIDRKNGLGRIHVGVMNNRDELVLQGTSITEIAKNYFDRMIYDVRHRNQTQNYHEFPNNLLANVVGSRKNNIFTADYFNYFVLIQHAGGFVS